MDLTGGTRATATTAGTILLGGLTLTLYGAIRGNAAHSIGGTCFTIVALTVIALLVIRRWVVDTSAERQRLATAELRTLDEYVSYMALKAALVNEQGRLREDLAAERTKIYKTLAQERAAMQEEFELARSEVSSEAMRILASWYVDGKVRPPERAKSNLIAFPQQEPQRDRPREHGVVGP